MADMMAIISKAVFEKAAGKAPAVGTKLRMDRYVSANKALDKLAGGGRLYLVTVRPDDVLWLVAVLERPKFERSQWVARACDTPIVDISGLQGRLVFESGKGITAAKGQLGMSLQAPRALTQADVRLLDAAASGGAAGDDREPARAGAEGFPPAPEGAIGTGGGNRRELLLAAIVADPDNLAARQVYADALAAANDPRGELILLDAQLDGPLSIRKRGALTERKAELLRRHAKTWFPYRIKSRMKGGFIVAVAGSLKQLGAAAALFASEPVTEVEVTRIEGTAGVTKLLAAPWLPRVHKLVVRGALGDDGFAALVGSPRLATLRALNVTANELGAEALAALRGNLPACRLLVLTNNPIGEGLAGLARWDHLRELDTLYLGKCRLAGTDCERLVGGGPLAKLTRLSLSENQLGNAIGKLVAKHAAQFPALEHLELQRTGIGAPAVQELAGARLPALRRLDLRRNQIDAKHAAGDPRIRV